MVLNKETFLPYRLTFQESRDSVVTYEFPNGIHTNLPQTEEGITAKDFVPFKPPARKSKDDATGWDYVRKPHNDRKQAPGQPSSSRKKAATR